MIFLLSGIIYHPIIAEVDGIADFVDIIDGVTVNRQIDELTGLSNIMV